LARLAGNVFSLGILVNLMGTRHLGINLECPLQPFCYQTLAAALGADHLHTVLIVNYMGISRFTPVSGSGDVRDFLSEKQTAYAHDRMIMIR
jgi:hypothetical protein